MRACARAAPMFAVVGVTSYAGQGGSGLGTSASISVTHTVTSVVLPGLQSIDQLYPMPLTLAVAGRLVRITLSVPKHAPYVIAIENFSGQKLPPYK
eukprot:COSAG03_NODE_3564_length_1946_cov_4354.898755_2_plen_96_part_00